MSASIQTMECFPRAITLGPWELPAPEVAHERCQGGQTTPGVLGGWRCPCPCHHTKEA